LILTTLFSHIRIHTSREGVRDSQERRSSVNGKTFPFGGKDEERSHERWNPNTHAEENLRSVFCREGETKERQCLRSGWQELKTP
jgi:hypothetical protein